MIPLLETERLVLREITERDFDAVHAYASDLEVVQYVPWGPNTESRTALGAESTYRKVARLRIGFGDAANEILTGEAIPGAAVTGSPRKRIQTAPRS